MKITTTMHAFIGQHAHVLPQELQTSDGLQKLSYFATDSKYWREQGYTYVGPATVTVEVPDVRALVDNKVEQLRQQEVAIRAKATAECTAIQTQIQNLLAIEYTPEPQTEQS
jgi:hypothetical protein